MDRARRGEPQIPHHASGLGGRSGVVYFWDDRVLYIGPGLAATVHAHQAVQVCIPLTGKVRLRRGPASPWNEFEAAAIGAGEPHESDVAVAPLATFWLDPGLPEARALVRRSSRRPIVALDRTKLGSLLLQFTVCLDQRWSAGSAAALLAETTRRLTLCHQAMREMDSRVVRVAELARSNRYRRRWLAELASSVSLSPSRLEHLFRSEMGTPLRRYLLWQRLRRAAQELAEGRPVTEAALAADFADTAHLSRTFRRMLGFTPSSALELKVSRFVQA